MAPMSQPDDPRTRWFAEEWPTLSRRLAGTLRRRGLSGSDRDDVVQETAMRVFQAWTQLDSKRSLEPFAQTVAINVWRDRLRRAKFEDSVAHVPDQVGPDDSVEQICVLRDELAEVGRSLATM